jgi:hypothetical protein
VRELVNEDEVQPIVVERQRPPFDGWAREHDHTRIRSDRGPPVGRVDVIGQQDLDPRLRGLDERLLEPIQRRFGDDGSAPTQCVEPIRKADPEVFRVDRAPGLVGRHVLRRQRHRRPTRRQEHGDTGPQPPARLVSASPVGQTPGGPCDRPVFRSAMIHA